MKIIHTYACKDYPGMEECSARFSAESVSELWKHIELHASAAHGEDPSKWSRGDKDVLKSLIKTERKSDA